MRAICCEARWADEFADCRAVAADDPVGGGAGRKRARAEQLDVVTAWVGHGKPAVRKGQRAPGLVGGAVQELSQVGGVDPSRFKHVGHHGVETACIFGVDQLFYK